MKEKGGPISNNNLPIQQLLPSQPPSTLPIQYTLSHIRHHSVTYAYHPFFQYQCHLAFLVHSQNTPATICPPQFCTHHLTALANLSQTHQELSHILHYSAITHYTPLITNHSTSLLILQPSSSRPQPEQ